MERLIDFILLLLFALILYKIQPIEHIKDNINKNALSISNTLSLRGILAMTILLHHISQITDIGVIFPYFRYMGQLSVACFFFLSGYGLQKQYMIKDDYKDGFIKKRLSSILIPYALAIFIYWIGYKMIGLSYSLSYILSHIIHNNTFVSNSWYIIVILFFYIFYWILMNVCKKNYNKIIILSAIYWVFYSIIMRISGFGVWWYSTMVLLIIGMIWAIYERDILNIFKKFYWVISPVTFILFVFLFVLNLKEVSPFNGLIFRTLMACCFGLCIVELLMKFNIGNNVLKFLGKYSLEIYLIHGLFISMIKINEGFIYSIVVIICSLITAWILHNISKKIKYYIKI